MVKVFHEEAVKKSLTKTAPNFTFSLFRNRPRPQLERAGIRRPQSSTSSIICNDLVA